MLIASIISTASIAYGQSYYGGEPTDDGGYDDDDGGEPAAAESCD